MKPQVRNMLRQLLKAPYAGKGAAESELQSLIEQLEHHLPADYLDFMRETNGYNGEVGKHGYVCIWPVEEIAQTNQANHFREWIPGLILFGSNEGGEYFAFDTRRNPVGVVMVPMIPLELDSAVDVGASFVDFIERLGQQ
jgi:hypothetical protein